VIEFAATIPPRLKLKGLREKHVLREGAKALLPESIVNRVKQPYRAPDHAIFMPGGVPLDYVRERCAPDAVKESDIFSANGVQTLLAKCGRQEQLGAKDGMALVGVLSAQLLHQQFVQKQVELEVSGG
jgi:asparagine synthase (glutamine-hydrolysing)